MDYSPPGSSVHGILYAKILAWVAMPSPGDLPHPGIELTFPELAGGFFTTESLGKCGVLKVTRFSLLLR